MKLTFPIAAHRGVSRLLLIAFAAFLLQPASHAQQIHVQAPSGGIAEIYASGAQRKEGDVYIADKDVDITYGGMQLQAEVVRSSLPSSKATLNGNPDSWTRHKPAQPASATFELQAGW